MTDNILPLEFRSDVEAAAGIFPDEKNKYLNTNNLHCKPLSSYVGKFVLSSSMALTAAASSRAWHGYVVRLIAKAHAFFGAFVVLNISIIESVVTGIFGLLALTTSAFLFSSEFLQKHTFKSLSYSLHALLSFLILYGCNLGLINCQSFSSRERNLISFFFEKGGYLSSAIIIQYHIGAYLDNLNSRCNELKYVRIINLFRNSHPEILREFLQISGFSEESQERIITDVNECFSNFNLRQLLQLIERIIGQEVGFNYIGEFDIIRRLFEWIRSSSADRGTISRESLGEIISGSTNLDTFQVNEFYKNLIIGADKALPSDQRKLMEEKASDVENKYKEDKEIIFLFQRDKLYTRKFVNIGDAEVRKKAYKLLAECFFYGAAEEKADFRKVFIETLDAATADCSDKTLYHLNQIYCMYCMESGIFPEKYQNKASDFYLGACRLTKVQESVDYTYKLNRNELYRLQSINEDQREFLQTIRIVVLEHLLKEEVESYLYLVEKLHQILHLPLFHGFSSFGVVAREIFPEASINNIVWKIVEETRDKAATLASQDAWIAYLKKHNKVDEDERKSFSSETIQFKGSIITIQQIENKIIEKYNEYSAEDLQQLEQLRKELNCLYYTKVTEKVIQEEN